MVSISRVGAEDPHLIEGLFRQYASWIAIDQVSKNIVREIENFPGEYGAPGGDCFVALIDGRPAGCIAVRLWEDGICEMKRLYVDPRFRGKHIGRLLIERALEAARDLGYGKMRLDVIADLMPHAVELYRSSGFREIDQYRPEVAKSAKYFEIDL